MTTGLTLRILVTISILSSSASAAKIDLTFEKLKEILEKRNSRVESTRLEVEAAKSRQGSLLRSFLPSVELSGAQESFAMGSRTQKTQPNYGAEVKVNVFNGGRDQIQSEIRDLTTQKREVQLERVFSEELQRARSLYWEIIYSQDHISLVEYSIKINNQNLTAAERRIRSGVATASDRFEFEMKSVDLKRDLDEAKLQLRNQKMELSIVLNVAPTDEIQINRQLGHDHNFEELLKHSPKDYAFLFKENELQSEATALNSKSQGRTWWPKLDAFASYRQFSEREKDFIQASERVETILGLKMTLNFPAGFESGREASALDFESQAHTKLMDYQRKEIEARIENEFLDLRLRHNQVHDAEENILRADQYYKLTQSEYSRGAKNSPDVLGASDKLYEMKHKRLEIIRDFQISKSNILAKIGR
jgi:outer membrane protein